MKSTAVFVGDSAGKGVGLGVDATTGLEEGAADKKLTRFEGCCLPGLLLIGWDCCVPGLLSNYAV